MCKLNTARTVAPNYDHTFCAPMSVSSVPLFFVFPWQKLKHCYIMMAVILVAIVSKKNHYGRANISVDFFLLLLLNRLSTNSWMRPVLGKKIREEICYATLRFTNFISENVCFVQFRIFANVLVLDPICDTLSHVWQNPLASGTLLW